MAPPFFMPQDDPNLPQFQWGQNGVPPQGDNPFAALMAAAQQNPQAFTGQPMDQYQGWPASPGPDLEQGYMGMDPMQAMGQFPPQVGPQGPMFPPPSFMGQPPGFTPPINQPQAPPQDPMKQLASILPPGGPEANPDFLEFMLGKHDPHGSAMAAAIMANSVLRPSESLQWAQKFAEHNQQRQYQAEQNQLQREAMVERKKQEQGYSKVSKAVAGALTKNVDINEFIADHGQIGPDNVDELQAWVTAKAAVTAKGKEARQADDKTSGYKTKILGQNLKQPMEASIYTDPESPQYDADFAKNMEHGTKVREKLTGDKDTREAQMADLRAKNIEVLGLRAKLLRGARTDKEKENLKVLFDKAGTKLKLALQAMKHANDFEIFGGDWAKAQEVYDKNSATANDLVKEVYDIYGDIENREGITPSEAPGSVSSSKAKSGFAAAYANAEDDETKQALVQGWQDQYDDDPPIPKAPAPQAP